MASRGRRFRYAPIKGTWYRLVRSGRDPLDFTRTRAVGGRYNPPLSHPTLYLGDQAATCMLEVMVHAFDLPPTYDLIAVDVIMDRVVDLASRAGRRAARSSLEERVAPPGPVLDEQGAIIGTRYETPWEIGRLAWRRGADGIVVPSAALPAQRVLVVFERPSMHMKIRDRRPIPTDPRMRRLFGP